MTEPQIMINYEDRQVFCETCGGWIKANDVLITGKHLMDAETSEHRVWERRPAAEPKVKGVISGQELRAFHYDLVIWAEDHRQADRVMIERIGYEEDLSDAGVGDYNIDANPANFRELDPIEIEEES